MATTRYQHSPEQLALAQERKLKKLNAISSTMNEIEDKARILSREWIQLQKTEDTEFWQHVKVLTWNLLAQCLVRRELFPTSDCLKSGQREHMLYREILYQKADIVCLQEADRLEKLIPVLESRGYSHVYAAGPKKNHGCLIAFNKEIYTKVNERMVQYDHQEVRQDRDERARRGCSFRTTNIASLICLKTRDGKGLILATTHLFWHPKYTYERARQAGILIREVLKFQEDIRRPDWPCVISGDFNFAPDDPAYSLLVGDALLPAQEERLSTSRVVHVSIDPSIPVADKKTATDDDDTEEVTDLVKPITKVRPALPTDGLLTNPELIALFSNGVTLRSAYDQAQRRHKQATTDLCTFGDRVILPPERLGAYEPQWTSYTHYWKTVLDYIFVIDPPGRQHSITGFLKPPDAQDLEPGLPRKGISGSDHVSLSVGLIWQNT